MPLATPIPYYGGKARLAKRFVELMPEHRYYLEPYSGSAAVLLAKPPCEREVLNDLDGRLVNFWMMLRDHPKELIGLLKDTPYSEDEVRRAYEMSMDPLEDARRYFVTCTQTYNGGGTSQSSWSLSLTEGGWAPQSFQRTVDRLLDVSQRLKDVAVSNRDALKIIASFDREGAVIYADPPYVLSSRGGGEAYRHEQGDDHHRELAEVLEHSRACVLVSGYHSPLYDELFGHWETFEFPRHKTSAGGSTKPESIEVIWRKL